MRASKPQLSGCNESSSCNALPGVCCRPGCKGRGEVAIPADVLLAPTHLRCCRACYNWLRRHWCLVQRQAHHRCSYSPRKECVERKQAFEAIGLVLRPVPGDKSPPRGRSPPERTRAPVRQRERSSASPLTQPSATKRRRVTSCSDVPHLLPPVADADPWLVGNDGRLRFIDPADVDTSDDAQQAQDAQSPTIAPQDSRMCSPLALGRSTVHALPRGRSQADLAATLAAAAVAAACIGEPAAAAGTPGSLLPCTGDVNTMYGGDGASYTTPAFAPADAPTGASSADGCQGAAVVKGPAPTAMMVSTTAPSASGLTLAPLPRVTTEEFLIGLCADIEAHATPDDMYNMVDCTSVAHEAAAPADGDGGAWLAFDDFVPVDVGIPLEA